MSNVVVFQDGAPRYELTGEEICFPLTVRAGDVEAVVYLAMDARCTSTEVKAFVDDLALCARSSDYDEREIGSGDERGCHKFVDRHFRGILGVEDGATMEQMRAWLDANSHIKTRIWLEGFDRLIHDVDESAAGRRLSLAVPTESSVRLRRVLYAPSEDRVVNVRMRHVCRPVTEEDRVRHRKSIRMVERGRTQLTRINWETQEQIYGDLVKRLDGFLLAGQPCVESNRDKWIGLVPLSDKAAVVGSLFSRLSVKNG